MASLTNCFFCLIAIGVNAPTTQDSRVSTETVVWSMPVGIPTDADKEVRSEADRLRQILGVSAIIQSRQNPVCCFWLEIGSWNPQPGAPGYVVLIQPGGALILASDIDQLRRAISAIQASIKTSDNQKRVLPIGILTNYGVTSLAGGMNPDDGH